MDPSAPGALSAFLAANRAQFLSDIAKDKAKSWTIVMGNEAGGAIIVISFTNICTNPSPDLDSVASAIAYSFLQRKNPTIGG